MQDADDVFRLTAPQRDAGDIGFEHGLDHLLRRIVGADRDHLGAVDHHVGDDEIAQVEEPAEHVAGLLLDAALAVEKVDRAAQFLVRGEDRLILADFHSEPAEDPFHQHLDPDQHRAEQAHRPCDRARHRERDAVGRIERRGLRQYLGEHHDDDGHDDGRVDNADIAEPLPGKSRSRARRRQYSPRCCRAAARRSAARARRAGG